MIEEEDMEIFRKACEKYKKECEKAGEIYNFPSETDSEIADSKFNPRLVMLFNSNGQLAGYEYNPKTEKFKRVD
ncbi:MAG: hypothetical protein IMZ63_01850 [Actinobacteria bacterium]|nr:hypothetical protein [Actinomycetota bacterium]